MSAEPNAHHAGAGCSCADCLRQFPSVMARRDLVWIIYDGRAEVEDPFDCAVLEVCCSRRDLKIALHFWRGHDGVLFEYDDDHNTLLNERRVGNLSIGPRELLKRASRRELR